MSTNTTKLTPMMSQYWEIKSRYPNAILFFRMGDFYEMFDEDAKIASKILQIALTRRNKTKGEQTPMCGIPYFSAENYIKKLIRAGFKVAICEQVEDPKKATGLVKRDVIKIITPGTYLPEDDTENTYIMSVYQKNNLTGYAVADITTGEFYLYESDKNIVDEVSRFEPKEILIPIALKSNPSIIELSNSSYITSYEDWYFDYIEAYRTLLKNFKVSSLHSYECEELKLAISAAGALMNYLLESQKGNIHFKKIKTLRQQSYMLIDASTWRNLEIDRNIRDGTKKGSLLDIIDATLTPMGGRLLRSWLHNILLDLHEIKERQEAVECLIRHHSMLSELINLMKDIR
ncbi:MAG: DNA mismatch repair protein MutS, partial [Nitrospirae bacterium]